MSSRNDHGNRFVIDGIDWQDHCRNLTSVLRGLEWYFDQWAGRHFCSACGNGKPDHKEDCELAAVLAVDLWAMTETPKTDVVPDPDVRSNRLITHRQASMMRGILLCIREYGAVPSTATLLAAIELTNSKEQHGCMRSGLRSMKNKGMITGVRYELGTLRVTEAGLAALALYDEGEALR